MPVAKRGVTGDHRQRAATLEMNLAGADRVDGRAVRSRDVDPEMKRPRRTGDTRIVEHAAHRVRPIERSQRPAIQVFSVLRKGGLLLPGASVGSACSHTTPAGCATGGGTPLVSQAPRRVRLCSLSSVDLAFLCPCYQLAFWVNRVSSDRRCVPLRRDFSMRTPAQRPTALLSAESFVERGAGAVLASLAACVVSAARRATCPFLTWSGIHP